jgi:mannose-6-phosphate isomerase-like protein (cupin superfamily)
MLGDVKITYLYADSGSDYSLLKWETPPGVASPPVHIHHRTDEGFYVLAGTFGFLVKDTRIEVGAHSHVPVPKGQAHTFWNAGSELATCLIIITPPGFEGYFAELSAGLAAVGSEEAAMRLRQELSARFDIDVVGPSITP